MGSGKTFEMVAAAMASKRLGLCSKSMIVVPNHLIEQWAGEFLRLYPSANLLVARRKDFEPAHRKTFCSKIATGDYDAVIIGHSQFEKIPMSFERQQASIEKQIAEGKHAFIVATHTDRAHIHNHIIFNSTTLDCAHKFKDFYYSGLAIQRLSDLICLEHGLSIIEKVPYSQRPKRTIYEKRTTYRDQIRQDIDTILKKPPTNFDAFLRKLEEMGYEVKQGKHTAVKGKDQQRFVRLNSLGDGYAEEDIRAVIAGEKKHRSKIKSPLAKEDRVFNLLLIIDDKIRAKGPGYQRWATNYNLKQMAKTRIFLKEHGINSMDELREKASTTSADFDRIDKELKSAEQRLVEIAALKKNIINYAKTREVHVQYRKAGYSKAFFEAHREEITLHKAAKDAFQKMGVSKLPKVKELSEEYATVLEQKKSLYAQYRLSREEMREYQKALHNTEVFFDMDRNSEIDYHLKEEFTKAQTQK